MISNPATLAFSLKNRPNFEAKSLAEEDAQEEAEAAEAEEKAAEAEDIIILVYPEQLNIRAYAVPLETMFSTMVKRRQLTKCKGLGEISYITLEQSTVTILATDC